MKNLLVLLLALSFNAGAEIIDLSSLEDHEVAKILKKIDVEISVSEQDVNSSKTQVIFHVSKHNAWTGWETHKSCKLKKSGTSYKCKMEGVNMSHVVSSLSSMKYYKVSVSEPYEPSFCKDVRFDKSSLKIDKSKGFFSKNYTLIIDMDNCTFH